MTLAVPPTFQVHWSLVPAGEATSLVSPGYRLLAIWPAPVNHDACFAAAGFTLFGDNDENWDRAAERLLWRIIETLSRVGTVKLMSEPLKRNPPWHLRLLQAGRELPLLQQALLPMEWDSLPPFHARFGDGGVALRTGGGHFLLWISLPDIETEISEFIKRIAGPETVVETRLRWGALLPGPG